MPKLRKRGIRNSRLGRLKAVAAAGEKLPDRILVYVPTCLLLQVAKLYPLAGSSRELVRRGIEDLLAQRLVPPSQPTTTKIAGEVA